MPLTVMEFWQQEHDTYAQEQTTAQAGMAAAQQALAVAKGALATHVGAFATLGTQLQATRAQLASTASPADTNALNAHIRDLMVQQRAFQGALLDDKDALDWAQADLDAASLTLARASARFADADAKLGAAEADDQQRQIVRATLLAPPYDTLRDDANTLAGSATKTNADTAISSAFPAELVAIAELRAATRARIVSDRHDSVALAETALGAELGTDGGLDGAAAQAAIAYEQAERAVRDYVASARSRIDRARAILGALEAIALHPATTVPLMTAAQTSELTDASALPARQTAESHAVGIDTGRNTVENAQKALDAQILTAIHADVDTYPTDAAVVAARSALDAARTALAGDESTFSSGDKTALDDWQVIVPDTAWQTLLEYTSAVADLNTLKDVKIEPAGDADSLLKIVDDAEQAYGDALAAAAKARRRADYLADQVVLRQARLDSATTAYSARALSAIRGDSF